MSELPAEEPTLAVNDEPASSPAKEMLADLYFLVESLDRRVPRLERVGESQIAHDAAELRERALKLIKRLEE